MSAWHLVKRELVARPRLFRVLRRAWRVAIIPRETSRRALHAWRTRSFTERCHLEIEAGGHRFTIIVDPSNGLVDETIYARRMWDRPLTEALARYLAPGHTFVDVGANIGFCSLLAARLVGRTGRVHAFEPIPALVEQLASSARASGIDNIDVTAAACGAAPGRAVLFARRDNVGASSLAADDTRGDRRDVAVVQLDHALQDAPRVDVVKIDVEGFELDVLQGARAMLARHHPILVLEFSPPLYERIAPGLSAKLVSFLAEHGYAIHLLDGTLVSDLHGLARELQLRDAQRDLLCLPRS